MALPYMPLYVADYLGDTQHLTCEQHGAYLKLLMCLWRAEGELPNDRLKIARMVGLTPARWDKIAPEVMAFFHSNLAYFWSPRLNAELQKADEYLAQKRAASESAHEAKRLKKQETGLPGGVPTTVTVTTKDLFQDSLPSDTSMSPAEACEAIWSEAPVQARKRSGKGPLLKALVAAKARRKNLAAIRQAVGAYYLDPEKSKEDYRWARGVHRVVQDDYWESWAQAEGVEHIDVDLQRRNWRSQMRSWLAKDYPWNRDARGPAPDEPGCRIPLEIMAEFNYAPPQRQAAR